MRNGIILAGVLGLLLGVSGERAGWSARAEFRDQLDWRDQRWVEETLGSLTRRGLIGQLFTGWYKPVESERLVADYGIGSFIIGRDDALTIARTTNRLQQLSPVPLLFAADFEAGAGSRASGATLLPMSMALGAANDPQLAYQCGQITGAEARAIGIHWLFAPVVDVNAVPNNPIIGTRSYSEDPAQVIRMAKAFVEGAFSEGALCTLKHFPGHGKTTVDTHRAMAPVWGSLEEIETRDIRPFRDLLRVFPHLSVMTAHVWVPSLDSAPGPATLSPPVLRDLLRRKLDFKGILISDSYTMRGLTTRYSPEEAIVLGLKAGLDVVLNPSDIPRGVALVEAALDSGELQSEQLRASARRVLETKARLGLHRERTVNLEEVGRIVGCEEHREVAERVAQQALTLVRSAPGVLPLSGRSSEQLLLITLGSGRQGIFQAPDSLFSGRLYASHPGLREMRIDENSSPEDLQEALAASADVEKVIIGAFVWTLLEDSRLIEFIYDLLELDRPVILVSFGSPYLLVQIPDLPTYVCAYSHDPASQLAAADFLCGRIKAPGRLPVGFPGWIELKKP